MITLQLGTTTKKRNSTLVPVLSGASVEVLLLDNCSITKPVFKLRLNQNGMTDSDSLFMYNYCYCANFRRFYYIKEIVSETAVIFTIHCSVDVLATFRKDILKTNAFIVRAQSKTDISITDSSLGCCNPAEQTAVVANMTCGTPTKDGNYNLSLNCGGGVARTVALTKNHLQSLGDRLFSSDVIDRIKDTLFNPAECLGGCVWTPFTKTGTGAIEFKVGSETYGVFIEASDFDEQWIEIVPYVKYKEVLPGGQQTAMSDFRNFPPYAEYSLYLPVVGTVQLDARKLICDGSITPKIRIKATVCPRTGDITYLVYNGLEQLIVDASGNISYSVQVSGRVGNGPSPVSMAISAVGMVAGVATANPMLAIAGTTGMGSAFNQTTQYNTSIRGSMGGSAADIERIFSVVAITSNRNSSDSPSNIRNTIGMPLMEAHVLGSMSGFVSCHGAYVQTWGTEEEMDLIASFLNNSAGSYMGVYIE